MNLEIYKFQYVLFSFSKAFRTYVKSEASHCWIVEERKSKGRFLKRVFLRYLTYKRRVFLLGINFDTDNLDDIVRTIKKLLDLTSEGNQTDGSYLFVNKTKVEKAKSIPIQILLWNSKKIN